MIWCSCKMLNTILSDKCSKVITCKDCPIVRNYCLRETVSGEDELKFFYCGLRSSRVHNMGLDPLGMCIYDD